MRKWSMCMVTLLLAGASAVSGCGSATSSEPIGSAGSSPPSIVEPTAMATSVTTAPPSLSGWKEYRADRFKVWLPKTYIVGDPAKNDAVLVEKLRTMGPAFQEMADLLEQNPSASSFLAIDSRVGDSGGVTTLRIAEEQVGSAMTVDAYMDAVSARFPDYVKLVARNTIILPGGRAVRMQARFQIGGRTGEQVGYFIKCGDTIYTLAYTPGRDEIGKRLSSFDKSASTFTATP